jgi:hypothetical protein
MVEAVVTKTLESIPDNANQKRGPFVWTAKAADILEKVKRARDRAGARVCFI